MSGNVREAKTDPRVRRTRDTLGDALIALMQERPFDDITVQQVLDRAEVGRSTFYAHYRDKDDLFISDIEEFLQHIAAYLTRTGAAAERVVPARETFAHLADQRELLRAMKEAGKLDDVMELWRGIFARSIEERLRLAGVEMEGVELAVYAAGLSGSFAAMVGWWIDQKMRMSPEDMDALFHRMVWRGVKRSRPVRGS